MKNIIILKVVFLSLIASPLNAMRGARAALMRKPSYTKSFQNINRTQKISSIVGAKRVNQRVVLHGQAKAMPLSLKSVPKNIPNINKQPLVQPIKQETQTPVAPPVQKEKIVQEEKQVASDTPVVKNMPIQKQQNREVLNNGVSAVEINRKNQSEHNRNKSGESFKSFIEKNKIKTHDPYANLVLADNDDEIIDDNHEDTSFKKQNEEIKEADDLYQRRLNEFNESQQKYYKFAKKYELSSPQELTEHMGEIRNKKHNNEESKVSARERLVVENKEGQAFQFGQMIANGFNKVFNNDKSSKANHSNSSNSIIVKDDVVNKDRLDESKDSKNTTSKNEPASTLQFGQMLVNGKNVVTNGLTNAWHYGKDGMWYLWNEGLWKPMGWFSTEQYEQDPTTKQNVTVIKSKLRIYFEQYICKENMSFIAPLMRIGTGLLIFLLWYNPGIFSSHMTENTLMSWVAQLGLSTMQIIAGEAPATALATIGLGKFAGVLIPYISSWFGTGGAAVVAANNVPPAIKDAVNVSNQVKSNENKMGWGTWAFSWIKSMATWTSWYKMFSSWKVQNSEKIDVSKIQQTTTPDTEAIKEATKKLVSNVSDDGKKKFLEMALTFKNNTPDPDHLQKFFETASKEDQEKLMAIMMQSKT